MRTELAMSALGQKRTFSIVGPVSALPPKADITERDRHVWAMCFVRLKVFGMRRAKKEAPTAGVEAVSLRLLAVWGT
jgi:hypothetical protein